MKLLKKIVVFTLGLFTLVGLASCGNKEEAEDYSKLTFEEVFEIQQYSNPSGHEFAPGLTMTQLRSKTLDGAYNYYEGMTFNLKANYKVKIKSVTFSMATDEQEFSKYNLAIYYGKKECINEYIIETSPIITKTIAFGSECTVTSNSIIEVLPCVFLGSLYTTMGKCTIYNFSFDFEVLGK